MSDHTMSDIREGGQFLSPSDKMVLAILNRLGPDDTAPRLMGAYRLDFPNADAAEKIVSFLKESGITPSVSETKNKDGKSVHRMIIGETDVERFVKIVGKLSAGQIEARNDRLAGNVRELAERARAGSERAAELRGRLDGSLMPDSLFHAMRHDAPEMAVPTTKRTGAPLLNPDLLARPEIIGGVSATRLAPSGPVAPMSDVGVASFFQSRTSAIVEGGIRVDLMDPQKGHRAAAYFEKEGGISGMVIARDERGTPFLFVPERELGKFTAQITEAEEVARREGHRLTTSPVDGGKRHPDFVLSSGNRGSGFGSGSGNAAYRTSPSVGGATVSDPGATVSAAMVQPLRPVDQPGILRSMEGHGSAAVLPQLQTVSVPKGLDNGQTSSVGAGRAPAANEASIARTKSGTGLNGTAQRVETAAKAAGLAAEGRTGEAVATVATDVATGKAMKVGVEGLLKATGKLSASLVPGVGGVVAAIPAIEEVGQALKEGKPGKAAVAGAVGAVETVVGFVAGGFSVPVREGLRGAFMAVSRDAGVDLVLRPSVAVSAVTEIASAVDKVRTAKPAFETASSGRTPPAVVKPGLSAPPHQFDFAAIAGP